MYTQLHLNSVVPHGVGSSSDSIALEIIYEFLLQKFGQNKYRYISINQIGEDQDDFVMKGPGNKIHVNLRYPASSDFELRSIAEQNRMRLDVIHAGLLKIAEYESKIDAHQLELIRQEILLKGFSFEFVCKDYINKKNAGMIGRIVLQPKADRFEYYIRIEKDKEIKCNFCIYNGRPGVHFSEFFFSGKWTGESKLIIWGKNKEVEMHILVDECKAIVVNLTPYENPPYFTAMRMDVSEEQREKARRDWEYSLPPGRAAAIRNYHN